jgi:hypothetical protein
MTSIVLVKCEASFFVNVMHNFIQKVSRGNVTTKLHQELWDQVRKKQTKYRELVVQHPLLDMFVDAWFLWHYFATSLLFKPSFLLPQISTHAMVSQLSGMSRHC